MAKTKLRPAGDGYGSAHTVRIPLWPYLVAPLSCLAALPGTWLVHHYFAREAASASRSSCSPRPYRAAGS
jgi:hypothetical protein